MGRLNAAEEDEMFTLLKQAKNMLPDLSYVQILYKIREDYFPSDARDRMKFTDHQALRYLRAYVKRKS